MRPNIRLDSQPSTFQEIVESLNDMIYELDDQGRFKYANSTSERLTGYSKEELKNMPYWTLIKKEEQADVIKFYADQRNNNIRDTYNEFTMITKKGKKLLVGQNVRMEFQDGELHSVRAVARDLSKVMELQNQLDEKTKLLSSILNTIGEAVVVVDIEGNSIGFNSAAGKIFKTDKIALSEWAEWHGVYYEDKKRILAYEDLPLVKSLKGIIVDNFEAFIKNDLIPDGLFVTLSSRPLLDAQNKTAGAVLVASNITARKIAELELKKNEEKFRVMSDASPLGVFVSNINGDCEYTNAEYSKITGLTPEEARGKDWTKALHPDDRPDVTAKWDEAIQTGDISENEQRFVHPDGKVVWTYTRASVMRLQGQIVGYIGSIEDITPRKKYEQELLEAKREAEEASQMKEEFLSTMSHELRTPLNAVIGMSHLLLQDNPQPYQLENLNTLKFSAENLLALINDVLDFNKLEAGAIALEETEVNLHQLINSIQRTFQPKAVLQSVKLNTKIDRDIPQVIIGDPLRLSQMINNLVSNALKFTQEGSVLITAKLINESRKKLKIAFSIKDTGIGIPKDKLESIFERFSQAEKETTRKYGGTGLGLSITRKLIQMWGGDIQVSSIVNKGSIFTFTLDFKRANEAQLQQADSITSGESEMSLSGIRILIVDDSYINQLVAAKFLQRWGVTADKSDNGSEAIEMIKTTDYDAVLMDIEMPGMNGIEATDAIRELGGKFSKLPIIVLTAGSLNETKKNIGSTKVNGIIQKPFDPDHLYDKIAEVVKRSPTKKEKSKKTQSDFVSFEKIYRVANGDHQFVIKLIKTAIVELNKFRDIYLEAFRNRDEKLFHAMKHKILPSLQLFNVGLLESEINKGEVLFNDASSDPKAIKSNLLNVRNLFNTTIDLLKAKLESEAEAARLAEEDS